MSSNYGFWGKILHVDLTSQTWQIEQPSQIWYRLYAGGGLLGTWYLLQETAARIDPFDPENRLVFCSSVVAGLEAPGLARFSVVTKSPLSGGVAESRCEGGFGRSLKASGYDAIVLHGKAAQPTCLVLSDGRVTFESAAAIWGMDTYQSTRQLAEAFTAPEQGIAVIGPAGERKVRFASIQIGYSVAAARMGTGAVMGSKNLKAIVIRPGSLPETADPAALAAIAEAYQREMLTNSLTMWQKNAPGFSAAADLSDFDTAYIGINNYQSDLQVSNSDFTRAAYLDFFKGDAPCPGCPNACIKYIAPDPGSPVEACAIHQEVTGAMGPNLGNTSLQLTLKANELCNRYGLDPVSLGFTLSFAMECFEAGLIGLAETGGIELRFGNQAAILPAIEAIAARSGIGDLLAEGSRRAAESIGKDAQRFALNVKGIEMVSFEPRTQTNLALGYATAPIGPRYDICEHDWDYDTVSGWEHTLQFSRTLGILERIPMEYAGIDKVRNFKALYTLWSACDTLNICIFASPPTRAYSLETLAKLVAAVTGWQTSAYEFMRWGERRNHLMRIYNLREGLTSQDDTLPDRFYEQPIDFGRLNGTNLNRESFLALVQFLYEMNGWDNQGVPLPATLYDHHLEWTLPFLKR